MDMKTKKRIESSKDEPPTLRGKFFAPGQVRVYCRSCKDYHCHGWPEGTPLNSLEHRQAHCFNRKSRYKRGGYYIALGKAA